jgi:hypothetical protein
LPDNVQISHSKKWELGNNEDGYLIGLNNIIDLFSEALRRKQALDFDTTNTCSTSDGKTSTSST